MRTIAAIFLLAMTCGCPDGGGPAYVRGEGYRDVTENWRERERRIVGVDIWTRWELQKSPKIIEYRWFVTRAGSLRTEPVPHDVEVPK